MNDNLRYVSLQYIKGDNYEDVDSFKENEIRLRLNALKDEDILDNPEKVKELYDELINPSIKDKKKIGESFLDDLINYSRLKLIKKDLEGAKKTAEEKIKDIKEETGGKGNGNVKKGTFINARSIIAQSLVDVIAVIDMVNRDDIIEPPEDTSANALKNFLKSVKKKLEELRKVESAQQKIDKILKDFDGGKLLEYVISDFKKLKDDAIKKVKKLIDIDTIKVLAEALLAKLNDIKTDGKTKLAKIEITTGSEFTNIDDAITALEQNAKAKTATDATKATDAAKARILFDIVKSSIEKLNKEVDTTNTNIDNLNKLKDKIEEAQKIIVDAQTKAKLAVAAAKALTTTDIQSKAVYQAAQAEAEEAKDDLAASLETIKEHLEEAYKLLEGLRKSVIDQSDALEKDKKDYLKSLDKLVALYSSYLNICTKNILKYDRLFEHNEISNIDEAFMIKSYSDFLKKLNKLKQNLETKDMGKIKRALTDSINQLFNMYGVNTNNEAFMKAFLEGYYDDNGKFKNNRDDVDEKKTKDIDYIIDRIINYNLAK
jgi:hypothetical protein